MIWHHWHGGGGGGGQEEEEATESAGVWCRSSAPDIDCFANFLTVRAPLSLSAVNSLNSGCTVPCVNSQEDFKDAYVSFDVVSIGRSVAVLSSCTLVVFVDIELHRVATWADPGTSSCPQP